MNSVWENEDFSEDFSGTFNITRQTWAIESRNTGRDIHYYALKAQVDVWV